MVAFLLSTNTAAASRFATATWDWSSAHTASNTETTPTSNIPTGNTVIPFPESESDVVSDIIYEFQAGDAVLESAVVPVFPVYCQAAPCLSVMIDSPCRMRLFTIWSRAPPTQD